MKPFDASQINIRAGTFIKRSGSGASHFIRLSHFFIVSSNYLNPSSKFHLHPINFDADNHNPIPSC